MSQRGKAPGVPKSQEELEQEAADARAEEEAELAAARKRAAGHAKLFLMCAVACAVIGSGLAWVLADPPFAWGVTAGSTVMVVNLALLTWFLGKALLAKRNRSLYALGVVATFGLLLLAAGVIIRAFPESAMGFGIGLSVPVAAGMLFGLFRRLGDSD